MTDEQFQDMFQGLERFVAKRLDATDDKITALDVKIDAVEVRLNARIDGLEDKIAEVETNLMAELHRWVSPMEVRQRGQTSTVQALELDMILLKERLDRLEGKKSG